MPNSPAFDIASLLQTNNIGTTAKSTTVPFLAVGFEPDIKDRVIITVYDAFGRTSNPRFSRDEPTIQIRVKAASSNGYKQAYDAQQAIKDLILGMATQDINDTRYVQCVQVVDISSLAPDFNNRPVLVATYRLIREYSSPNRTLIE